MKVGVLTLAFATLVASCARKEPLKDDRSMLTKEQIIGIAREFWTSDDVPAERVKVLYDVDNKESETALKNLQAVDPEGARDIQSRLRGRSYQAARVYCDPPMMDGAYWIFIDKRSGEIIVGLQDIGDF